jgi:tRNA nucleotidyltransferase (CCA-adding enzyme)
MPPDEASTVEHQVLERLRPDAATEARVRGAREHLVAAAEAAARERQLPMVRCLVAGSGGRGTYLADRLDLDLFLLFPPEFPRAELARAGLEIGKAILTEPETRYAEHPYLRGKFEGFRVDAVPGYAITDSSKPQSAVDRTPFHQEYLLKRQTAELVDQIRLTKQFLRGLGIYGSEARTAGFSGYLVELLVHRFTSLQGLLKEASGWRIPVRLVSTPGATPAVPEDVALILDDPVDPGRNVATALSRAHLALFIVGASEYLARPSPRAFEPTRPTVLALPEARARVERRGTHVAGLLLPRPDLVDDILYPQLRKAERALAEEARRLGFRVVGTASAAEPDASVVLIEVEHPRVPAVRPQDGPPAGIDRVGSFLEKWGRPDAPVLQGPYVTEDGKLAVETERPERHLEPLLTATLDRLPIGKNLREAVREPLRMRPLSELSEGPALRESLGELLDKRLPWLR